MSSYKDKPVQQKVNFSGLGIIFLCTLREEQDAKPTQDCGNQPRCNATFQISHVLALSSAVWPFLSSGIPVRSI
jgi:hypothetical protein